MRLTELLNPERVGIERQAGPLDKGDALSRLAAMLASGTAASPDEVARVLAEREALQSTGIGEGVAIPHGALPQLDAQCAALLVVPGGVSFDAIDHSPVNILFAVIGPKRATGEHLKTLARVSRLLRNKGFRDQLLGAKDASGAYALISQEESK
jgi:PTS system nitrogen regulatory IIA component